MPARHAHEAAGAEGRRRAHARRSRRPVSGLVALVGPRGHQRAALRRRRAGRSAGRDIRRRRTSAIELQRHLLRDEEVRQSRAARSRVGVPPAGRRHQRRALCRAARPAALRRAHLHPPQDDARARRAAAELERRALSQAARRDGAAVQRSAGGHRRHPRAGRSARVHDGGSRLPLSRLPGAAGRDDGVVPAEDRAGGRARAVPAVSRSRARARSRAS